jgi:hypothetical protein
MPSQRRKIAERYAAGETMKQLATEYECGEATARGIESCWHVCPADGATVDRARHPDPTGARWHAQTVIRIIDRAGC